MTALPNASDKRSFEYLWNLALARFTSVIEQTRPRLISFLRWRFNAGDEAADIVQDTLVGIWESEEWFYYDDDKSARSRIYRIAIARLRNASRARRRLNARFAAMDIESVIDDELGHEAQATTISTLKNIKANVSARDWKILLSKHHEGLTAAEVAQRLGISQSTVLVTTHRLKNKFRGRLRKASPGPRRRQAALRRRALKERKEQMELDRLYNELMAELMADDEP